MSKHKYKFLSKFFKVYDAYACAGLAYSDIKTIPLKTTLKQ